MKTVFSTLSDPAFNLALEESLFNRKDDDYLLFYINDPCVVLGSNQVLQNEVNTDFCTKNNIPVLRRISGGGAVYHDRGNLNFSFIRTKNEGQSFMNADFLEPVIQVLGDLGVSTIIGKRKDLWLTEGFKISGTASHIKADRAIQHGTLLYDSNLQLLNSALKSLRIDESIKGVTSVPSPVKNIRTYLAENQLPDLIPDAFFRLMVSGLSKLAATVAGVLTQDDILLPDVEQSAIEKYRSTAWTERK
jgi:lipoate---protein ligase